MITTKRQSKPPTIVTISMYLPEYQVLLDCLDASEQSGGYEDIVDMAYGSPTSNRIMKNFKSMLKKVRYENT